MLSSAACYRAMASRDRRFEGHFVVAVRTTGVYCRPTCAAPLPKPENVVFFVHASAAEEAGFRPCRRCRPELSSELRLWPDTSRTVIRATRLIAEGGSDGNGSLTKLSARLGIGERHLRRLFAKHIGASPVAFAQSRRVHLARQLLDETTLSITDIALSAGFSSVRRFNEVFRRTFSVSPSEIRSHKQNGRTEGVLLRLFFKPPYDWDSLISFLAKHLTPGVESVEEDSYRRSIEIDGLIGAIEVRHVPEGNHLLLRVLTEFPVDLMRIVERVRRLFDLDCDPTSIIQTFKRDKRLGSLVVKHPGLRVPGAWDPFEMAARAILGQQTSTRAASFLAGQLVQTFGTRVNVNLPGISHIFPSVARLAKADVERIGVPTLQAQTIRSLAQATLRTPSLLDGTRDVDEQELSTIPGVGPWTTQYIAMRALNEPDAFPSHDLGVRKALSQNGKKASSAEIKKIAEAWRPFRAYAVMHLWRSLNNDSN